MLIPLINVENALQDIINPMVDALHVAKRLIFVLYVLRVAFVNNAKKDITQLIAIENAYNVYNHALFAQIFRSVHLAKMVITYLVQLMRARLALLIAKLVIVLVFVKYVRRLII